MLATVRNEGVLRKGVQSVAHGHFILAQDQPQVVWELALWLGVVAGLLLWLVGGRVVRPGCAVVGLLVGGIGTFLIRGELDGQGASLLWLIVGSMTGFLLATALFRIWVAVSCALLLALLIPVTSLVWEGVAPPADPHRILTEAAKNGAIHNQQDLRRRLDRVSQRQREKATAWWASRDRVTRRMLVLTACAGGLIGLVAGLIYPHKTALFESALVGSALVLLGVKQIVAVHGWSVGRWLPQDARAVLVLWGLITLLGCLLQWTSLRSNADS